MTSPSLCQVRLPWSGTNTGCPAHEAGRDPVTLVERIEHFYALAPGDRPTGGAGGEDALLKEALKELRGRQLRLLEKESHHG